MGSTNFNHDECFWNGNWVLQGTIIKTGKGIGGRLIFICNDKAVWIIIGCEFWIGSGRHRREVEGTEYNVGDEVFRDCEGQVCDEEVGWKPTGIVDPTCTTTPSSNTSDTGITAPVSTPLPPGISHTTPSSTTPGTGCCYGGKRYPDGCYETIKGVEKVCEGDDWQAVP